MYLSETPGTSTRTGTTTVTHFHPGINHAHTPTGRWADVQRDAGSRCQSLERQLLRDPRKALSVAEGLGVECSCSNLSPSQIATLVRNTLMRLMPLAQRHLDHYLSGGGANFVEDVEDFLRRDHKVRAKLAKHLRARPTGHFKIHQSDYSVEDFHFAFGAIDRFDYEVNRAAGSVHVWFQDRYEWHPVGFGYRKFPDDARRGSNCVHAAMVELKSSGARDFWMIGDAVLPLSSVVSPPPARSRTSGATL